MTNVPEAPLVHLTLQEPGGTPYDMRGSFGLLLVQQADGVSEAEARTRTRAALVPGVILQPSGVFAVLHAQQEAKALYIRAS